MILIEPLMFSVLEFFFLLTLIYNGDFGFFLYACSKIMTLGFNKRFIRTWGYYFDYCAAGFKSHTLEDYQVYYTVSMYITELASMFGAISLML